MVRERVQRCPRRLESKSGRQRSEGSYGSARADAFDGRHTKLMPGEGRARTFLSLPLQLGSGFFFVMVALTWTFSLAVILDGRCVEQIAETGGEVWRGSCVGCPFRTRSPVA